MEHKVWYKVKRTLDKEFDELYYAVQIPRQGASYDINKNAPWDILYKDRIHGD